MVKAAVATQDAPKTVDAKKPRGEHFAVLTQQDVDFFKNQIGETNVIEDTDEISPFVKDFTKKYMGIGSIVLTPSTTEEISECLKYCNER